MIKINLFGDNLSQGTGKKADRGEPMQFYGETPPARGGFPIVGTLVALVFMAIAVVYYIDLNRKVEKETLRKVELEKLKKELEPYEKLEAKFRKDFELIQRKKAVIKDLRITQHLPVHLMEELANALPDDVWFRDISQKGLAVTISGESASFEAINLFRTNLMGQTTWFGNVNYPTATKKGSIIEFTLSFDMKKPG